MRFFLLVFFIIPFSAVSQIKLDSLIQVWENPLMPDTARTTSVNKIIWDGYMFTNLDSAKYYSLLALDFSAQKNLRKQEGEFFNLLGITFYLSSQYNEAEEYYLKSLDVMEELQYPKGIAAALTNLGAVHSALGNHQQALEHLLKALVIRESLGDLIGMAIALNNIGNIYRRQENFVDALQCHRRALAIYLDKDNKRSLSNTLVNIGLDYMDMSDFETALIYFNQSLAIQEEINYSGGIVLSLNNIGSIYQNLANYPKAIEYHQRSAKLSAETNNMSSLANSYNNLGIVYFYQGNYLKALKSYEEALAIRRKNNEASGISSVLLNIGIIYKKLNNFELALKYYFEARKIALEKGINAVIVSSLNNIAALYFKKGDLALALDYLNQSLRLQHEEGDQILKSATLASLAEIRFEMNEMSAALDLCNQGLAISQSVQAERETNTIRRILVDIFMNQKEYNQAEISSNELMETNRKFLAMNFPIMTEGEQAEYVQTISGDFDMKFSLALRRKKDNPAICESTYNDVLYLKGILLKSSTATRNAILSSGDATLIEKYQEWIVLKRQITKKSDAGKSFLELEQRADSLERYLVESSREISDFKNLQNQTWEDVKAALKNNEAAIEMIHFKKKSFAPRDTAGQTVYCAMVVTKNCIHPEMIELFDEQQLITVMGIFQGNNLNFINSLYGKRRESEKALYELIWKPLETVLVGTKKIFISPTGLLHKISFAALSKENNVFLCDNLQIRMVSSTGKIISPEHFVFNENSTTTVFGGIEYNTDSTTKEMWSYLEGTKYETENIDRILERNNFPVVYLNSANATESEFKLRASTSSVLHIATHGFFFPNPDELIMNEPLDVTEKEVNFRGNIRGYSEYIENKNPMMRSGLVFAGANNVWSSGSNLGDDGVLTAQEVVHIDMRGTQLVVLSACETGLGDIKGSEGVYGLQRAFKMAGVKFIIMSLWQVPDKETAEFMTLFYKKLIKDKDVHKAFNTTQLVMRSKYDPYYWAAFVLVE